MQIKPPDELEYAALVADLGYRYPEKARITLPGDGGVPIALPFVLGNPTGACALPAGIKASPAWNKAVAVALRLEPDDGTHSDRLVDDCVLFPDRKTLRECVQRWPGLYVSLIKAVRQKSGSSVDVISEPDDAEMLPAVVASAIEQNPSATARLLQVRSEKYAIAIQVPQAIPWKMFVDAVNKPNAKVAELATEIALTSVIACGNLDTGKSIEFSAIAEQWPGVLVAVVSATSKLAGAAAAVEVGSF